MVLPSWITDSVERGELQPYDKYLLINQNRITDFFSSATSPTSLSDEGVASTAEAVELRSKDLLTGQLHGGHVLNPIIKSSQREKGSSC